MSRQDSLERHLLVAGLGQHGKGSAGISCDVALALDGRSVNGYGIAGQCIPYSSCDAGEALLKEIDKRTPDMILLLGEQRFPYRGLLAEFGAVNVASAMSGEIIPDAAGSIPSTFWRGPTYARRLRGAQRRMAHEGIAISAHPLPELDVCHDMYFRTLHHLGEEGAPALLVRLPPYRETDPLILTAGIIEGVRRQQRYELTGHVAMLADKLTSPAGAGEQMKMWGRELKARIVERYRKR